MIDDEPEAWRAPVGDDQDASPEPVELPAPDDQDVAGLLDEAARAAAANAEDLPDGDDPDPWAAPAAPAPGAASVWDVDPRERTTSIWDLDAGGDGGSVWDAAGTEPAPIAADGDELSATSAQDADDGRGGDDEDEDDGVFRAAVAPAEHELHDLAAPDDATWTGGAQVPRSWGEVPTDADAAPHGVAADDPDDEPAPFTAGLVGTPQDDASAPSPGARGLVDGRHEQVGDEDFRVEATEAAQDTLDDLLRESAAGSAVARAGAPAPDAGTGDVADDGTDHASADDAATSSLADRAGDETWDDAESGGATGRVDGWDDDTGVWSFTVAEPDPDDDDRPLAERARPDRDTGWADASTPVTPWPRSHELPAHEPGPRAAPAPSDGAWDVTTPRTAATELAQHDAPVGIDATDVDPAHQPFAPPTATEPHEPTGELGVPVAAEPGTTAAVGGVAGAAASASEVQDLLGDLFGDEEPAAPPPTPTPAPPTPPTSAPVADDDASHDDATAEPAAPVLRPGSISFSAGGGRGKRRRKRR